MTAEMDDSQQATDEPERHRPAGPAETDSGRSYFPAYVVSQARWNLADLRVRRRYPRPR
jgi:hypothetical protein